MRTPQNRMQEGLAAVVDSLVALIGEEVARQLHESGTPEVPPAVSLPASPWMSVEQAAAYSGMNGQTIARACRTGELTASQKRRKGRWLIRRDDLDAWIRG